MHVEHEAKFLGVSRSELAEALRQSDASNHLPRMLQRRVLFDTIESGLRRQRAWLRVREEAVGASLTLKKTVGTGVGATAEIEVAVTDFGRTCELFKGIGLVPVAHQESWRESWELSGCSVTWDEWPWIPPIVEIEGPSEADVRRVSALLGLLWSRAVFGSVSAIYDLYYVNGGKLVNTIDLTFVKQHPALIPRRVALP